MSKSRRWTNSAKLSGIMPDSLSQMQRFLNHVDGLRERIQEDADFARFPVLSYDLNNVSPDINEQLSRLLEGRSKMETVLTRVAEALRIIDADKGAIISGDLISIPTRLSMVVTGLRSIGLEKGSMETASHQLQFVVDACLNAQTVLDSNQAIFCEPLTVHVNAWKHELSMLQNMTKGMVLEANSLAGKAPDNIKASDQSTGSWRG